MFQFLFKYPSPVFTKGRLVLLSAWPAWLLPVLIVAVAGGLALLIHWRVRHSEAKLRGLRVGAIWATQSAFLALLLLLLWQPALIVAELGSNQNIIAGVGDDSRSMGIADSDGKTREAAAIAALDRGVLAGLRQRFQTRIYRLGREITPVDSPRDITPGEVATHIDHGSEIGAGALHILKERRLPVHTVGFGMPEHAHDIEIEDVSLAASAVTNARIATTVTLVQHGYAGQKTTLTVRDGDKAITQRDITLAPDGRLQTEPLFFPAGSAGAKSLTFAVEALPGEESVANNAVMRPFLVSDAKRRILYVEGEPRWEYKFIRRAEDNDPTMQIVSMLRTSENKVYRQGISNPAELAQGFPVRAEDLFAYSGIIIGSVAADYFTPLQQELLREYVDRRGGGILFLGGSSSLSDGGWGASSLNALLPTFLPSGNHNFRRNPAV